MWSQTVILFALHIHKQLFMLAVQWLYRILFYTQLTELKGPSSM